MITVSVHTRQNTSWEAIVERADATGHPMVPRVVFKGAGRDYGVGAPAVG